MASKIKSSKMVIALFLVVAFVIMLLSKTPMRQHFFSASLGLYSKDNHCPKTPFFGAREKYSSQAYEDYVLGNIFTDVKNGFYVDVGANNPDGANVSKYFYAMGWHGMNFEPQTKHYEALLLARKGDININKAVSDTDGDLVTFYIPQDADVLSSLDPNLLQSLPSDAKVDKVTVETTTLTKAFKEHNIKDIDFLKIDVEGYEDKVVAGLDFSTYRPKVVVLEYVSPTGRFGYQKFTPIMLNNGYLFGMSDGLNYYFYRQEDVSEFEHKFKTMEKCVIIDRWRRGI
ncbi:MAG: FkbM family methyltransferase [Pseudomonadota bacterium]